MIARKYFECGDVSLETSAKDLDTWPLPSPGHSSELPLMGHLFHLVLPSQSTRSVESGCETVTLAPSHGDLLPAFETIDLFLCLLMFYLMSGGGGGADSIHLFFLSFLQLKLG